MPQCRDSDDVTAVTLSISADPCPLSAGFSSCDHIADVNNQRSTKIYDVSVISKSLYNHTDLDGKSDVIATYSVIRSTGQKHKQYDLTATSGSSGQTDEIQATIKFCDETQRTTEETLTILYDIDIP